MPIFGFKELSEELKAMGKAPAGKALRAAASSAMNPALAAAKAAAPVADPPYHVGAGIKSGVYGAGKIRTVDPFPVRTYLGRLTTPGFARRMVARKVKLDKDGSKVQVMIGVQPEAFYALQFIELGTSSIAKQPWLEPSFRRSYAEVDRQFRDKLKAQIDKAAKK